MDKLSYLPHSARHFTDLPCSPLPDSMDTVCVYFRSTFRHRFDFGAMLFKTDEDHENNDGGIELDLDAAEAEMSTEEQWANEMVDQTFGSRVAAEFTVSDEQDEATQLADDLQKACLYTLPLEKFDGSKYGLDMVVQYRRPGWPGYNDWWSDCVVLERDVYKAFSQEEEYIVARMLPKDFSHTDALQFHIYLILPREYAAKSLRKKAQELM